MGEHQYLIDHDGAMWCGDECVGTDGPHHEGETPPGEPQKVMIPVYGIDVERCLTHGSEFYDEALCFAQMARLYHETGGNNLAGLSWVNEQYGECKWIARRPCTECGGSGSCVHGIEGLHGGDRDLMPCPGGPCTECGGSGIGSRLEAVRSVFYDDDGHLFPDKLKAVEDAIREFPDFDAPQWLGGVSAIREVLAALDQEGA